MASFRYKTTSIEKLMKLKQNPGLDFNPEFQREFVWSKDFKGDLILSLLKGYPIGNITLWENDKGNYEIVDGQQRIKTIFWFITDKKGEFTSFKKEEHKQKYWAIFDKDWKDKNLGFDPEDVETVQNFKRKPISFANLPLFYQNRIKNTELSVLYMHEKEKAIVAEYFVYIQNQDRLRAGEIISAFPNSKFDPYLKKVRKLTQLISKERLKFTNQRKDFTKLFVNIVGLEENKLKLGCIDRQVIDFVAKNIEQLNLKNSTQSRIDDFLFLLEKIINLKTLNIRIESWKRFFKLFFILFFICKYNFEPNLEEQLIKLSEINTILKIHDSKKLTESGKQDEIKKFYGDTKYWSYLQNLELHNIMQRAQDKERVEKITREFARYLKSIFNPQKSSFNSY